MVALLHESHELYLHKSTYMPNSLKRNYKMKSGALRHKSAAVCKAIKHSSSGLL